MSTSGLAVEIPDRPAYLDQVRGKKLNQDIDHLWRKMRQCLRYPPGALLPISDLAVEIPDRLVRK